jgi:hypothetical protein
MNDQKTEVRADSITETNGSSGSERFGHKQPKLGQRARELQHFGEVTKRLRIGLSDDVRAQTSQN